MYRPDGRKSPACQTWSSLRGVLLVVLPMGRLSPGRYAGTPPSAANAAGTRLSKEIMVRKAPSFFIGTSPSRLYRACVCPTGVGAPRGGHAPPGAAAAPLARREGAIHRASRVRERRCRPPARLLPCSTAGAQQMFPGRAPILQWGIKKGDAQSFSVQEERTTPLRRGGRGARQGHQRRGAQRWWCQGRGRRLGL